jgi:spore coat polysaccharide biosynthesis protein SpsF
LNVTYPADLSALRWTVDYEEDLTFVREVYRRLYREGEVFGMGDILVLMEAEPELTAINARHTRNEGYTISLAAHRHT